MGRAAVAYLWSPLPLPLHLRLLPRRRTPHLLRRHQHPLPHRQWRHTCGRPIVSYLSLDKRHFHMHVFCLFFVYPLKSDGAAS